MKVKELWRDNFGYYVYFSKSISFILGLMFSYKLVEKTFFDILITYLTDEMKDDLRKAAIVVNIQQGIFEVLQIFLTFIADAYTGLFNMVVGSTALFVIGMFLIYFMAWNGDGSLDRRVFYPALVLVTVSGAAGMSALVAFLGDQMAARNWPARKEDEERAQARINFWRRFVSILATFWVLFGPLRTDSFRHLTLALAIAMGAALLWFLLGIKFYNRIPPTGSALSYVVHVIHIAILKRNVEYPKYPYQLHENSSSDVEISPRVPWLRWLDRAAVKQESPAGQAAVEQESPAQAVVVQESPASKAVVVQESPIVQICAVEDVKGVKLLLNMLPMWTTFLTFSLVVASGSTFFLEEAFSLTDNTSRIQSLINLQGFTEIAVSELSDYVLEKLGKKKNKNAQRMMLVRIGIGMLCCALCCIAAWANALHMLHVVRIHGDPENHMSPAWLIPQFILLGVMEGLSQDGLESFFASQVTRSISKYGPPFGGCVMGFGKFLSVICILTLSKWFHWFHNEPKPRRLDKYYVMLIIISFLNFTIYCLVAYWYGDDEFLLREADMEMAISGQADQQADIVAPLVSGQIVSTPEQSNSGENTTESTNTEQSQTNEDSSLPLSRQEIGQEMTSSMFPTDDRCDDHEAETLELDVSDSPDQVSLLASESTMNRPSNVTWLRTVTAFSSLYTRVVRRRSHSMQSKNL